MLLFLYMVYAQRTSSIVNPQAYLFPESKTINDKLISENYVSTCLCSLEDSLSEKLIYGQH